MAHAITASSSRYDHMSPVAAALAAGLHVATALALFLVSPLNRPDVDVDDGKAIEVTIEQPKPPETPPVREAVKPQPAPPAVQPPAAQPAPPPPPPPAAAQKLQAQPQPQQPSKEQLGLPPKGAVEPDKKPEAKLEPKPEPAPEPKPEPPQEAAAQPAQPTPPPPPPEKPLEKVLPPVEQPPAPLSMRDFVKVLPPPPAPPPAPPAPRPPPPQQHPQPPQQHSQQPQPSPLSQRPPPREQEQASVSEFQNPAAAYNHARVHDDYLVGIARKMSQYRFVPSSMKGLSAQGVVVLSLVVARDGRLLNAGIARSSGNPPMDKAVLETAQKAAPYAPLPAEIPGASATFTLSVPYRFVADR